MAKKKKFRLKESLVRKFAIGGMILGLVGSLLGVGGLVVAFNAESSYPRKPQMQYETLSYSRVQNYAMNFFQVWMMGDMNSKQTLENFYSAIPLSDLNADPAKINNLNVADLKVSPTEQGEILWEITLGTTMTPPGVTASTRQYYKVDVLQKGESLTIAKLPQIVSFDRPPLKAGNGYQTPVSTNSPLYQVAVNFAATYLTPQSAESFGRYVSANFEGNPLSNSPYTGAEVVGVFVPRDTVVDQVSPGSEVSVLIRVRASTSRSSYQTMDIPITAIKQENGQWLVNSMSKLVTDKSAEKNLTEGAPNLGKRQDQ